MTLKTYSVPGVRPSASNATPTRTFPDPTAGEQGADFVRLGEMPYSNSQRLTSEPLAFTDACRWAEVEVTSVALPGDTVGAWGMVVVVVLEVVVVVVGLVVVVVVVGLVVVVVVVVVVGLVVVVVDSEVVVLVVVVVGSVVVVVVVVVEPASVVNSPYSPCSGPVSLAASTLYL